MKNILTKIFDLDKSLSKNKRFIFLYTILFGAMCALVFVYYYAAKKTFIWSPDGWYQTYRALIYYAKLLRSLARTFFTEHTFAIPQYDFALGEGDDILSSFHYYGIGDPLCFLAVLVPTKFLVHWYNFCVLARLYCAGLGFYFLCTYTSKKNILSILTASLLYVFCSWSIMNAVRHIYFLIPLAVLPFMILGIEKILKHEKPFIFILSVFYMALSNFYFLYMIAVIAIIYTLIRLFFIAEKFAVAINHVIRISLYGILAVAMAGVIFMPMAYVFLGSARFGVGYALHLFYPFSHYAKLPSIFIATGDSYWLHMGYASPVLIAVFLLFSKKQNSCKSYKFLKVLFVTGIILSCFPIFGKILNGFGYVSNRWSWAFALIVAYILVAMWEDLMNISGKEVLRLFASLVIYSVMCFVLYPSRNMKTFVALTIAYIFLFVIAPLKNENSTPLISYKSKQIITLCCVAVAICANSFYKNAPNAENYAKEAVTFSQASKVFVNETLAIKSVAEKNNIKDFYRYSGRNLELNAGMNAEPKLSSTSYYTSLNNTNIYNYRVELGIPDWHFQYRNFDDRTIPTAFESVLYYAVPKNDNKSVPFGFELAKTTNDYKIFENKFFLPLSYSYEKYITKDEWNALSTVQKQAVFLEAAVLDKKENDGNLSKLYHKNFASNAVANDSDIPYEIICNGEQISMTDKNTFVVTKANSTATINFVGESNAETYIDIKNLQYSGINDWNLYSLNEKYDPKNLYSWNKVGRGKKLDILLKTLYAGRAATGVLKLKASNGSAKNINCRTPEYQFYNGQHDFSVNFGYAKEAVTSITITFANRGIYTFENMAIAFQKFDDYAQQISELKKDTLQNIKFATNSVTGEIALERDKILCLSIPYHAGWKAFVDGKRAELFCANSAYLALEMTKGFHTVELKYERPLHKTGIFVSIIAILIFACLVIFLRKPTATLRNS